MYRRSVKGANGCEQDDCENVVAIWSCHANAAFGRAVPLAINHRIGSSKTDRTNRIVAKTIHTGGEERVRTALWLVAGCARLRIQI